MEASSNLPINDPAPSKISKPNSEARRQQNRIASRNYRQKRKQKLALLDSLLHADEVVTGNSDPSSSSTSPPDQLAQSGDVLAGSANFNGAEVFEAGPALMKAITNHGWKGQPNAQRQPPAPGQLPSTIAPSIAFAPSTAFTRHDQGPAINMSFASRPPVVPQMDDYPPTPQSQSQSQSQSQLQSQSQSQSRSQFQDDDAILPIMESVQNLSLQQKQELLKLLQRQTETEANTPGSSLFVPEPARANLSSYELEVARNWVSANGKSLKEVTRLQSEARRFASFINKHVSSGFSPAQLSRIYTLEVSLFGAIFANCYALGMHDVEDLMIEEGVSVFSVDQDTGHPRSQLVKLRSKFKEITPDLQPCDEQLTFGHHPYIDVLPFRNFRDNALKALQQNPPLFDEDEFCFDFCGGGLICWGSQQNSMGMEAGVPWDARSWEPQVWFLKKYWYLVGGWDDEMWKAARWWHSMRGEKINLQTVEPSPWVHPTCQSGHV